MPPRLHTSRARTKEKEAENTVVHLTALGPEGQQVRVDTTRFAETRVIRNQIAVQVQVPPDEMQLQVDGEVLWEVHGRPFEGWDADELAGPPGPVVQWWRCSRLRALLEHRGLSGVNAVGRFGRSALHFAIAGDCSLCRLIVEDETFEEATVDLQDQFGDTPLMLAAILGFDTSCRCWWARARTSRHGAGPDGRPWRWRRSTATGPW
ncbi:unnamed protein product [Prorocentrum cordatum]|uniref:Ankyrin repeat domain-containing protein n=1 Tax=Prorocentrum cordatum TaxID=2364126 RepID=A0ABN9QHJ7_9DINO|nr:unnamed protein product [Polarella glacialis]